MFLSGELREKDAADSSLPVDDIRHASWQPESRRDAIALSDYAIRITQQDEGGVGALRRTADETPPSQS